MDAANLNPYLLSYDGLETLGRTFRGTTDVVVADRVAVRTRCPQMGLRVLFKLKKAITDSDVVPARARVLLANLHSPDNRPVMVSPQPVKCRDDCRRLFSIALQAVTQL